MANVLVVDDHPAIRMAVSLLLQQDGHNICGEVDNGVDAIQECKRISPDIVVLDIGIPKLDGIEVIKRMRELENTPFVVVLSAQDSHHIMIRSFQAGASGFVSKLEDLTLLNKAIKACLAGEIFFPTEIRVHGKYSADVNNNNILKTLSDREMSVLIALCQGRSNKLIANDMLLSEKTISTYKTRVMQKLQVSNMVELIELTKRHMNI
ncbi:response regulator [Aeromonas caviae]|uniref:response regulator n=2 Tax=Aeromonas TaxID=642 RepID=UPI0038D05362